MLKLSIEVISLLIIGVIALVVLFPIYSAGVGYPFYKANILFLVIFFTAVRYIFLMKYTPFSHNGVIKTAMVFICIPIIGLVVDRLFEFQKYLDEVGLQNLVDQLEYVEQTSMIRYMRTEMLFFGAAALVSAIILPFRLIRSIWTVKNRNRP